MVSQPRPTRVTLSDVAERAGVSAVTVSRALRKSDTVSPLLRARVESAARELAYVPNQLARALASSRTGRIAAIVPSFTNGVFDDYLRALHDTFEPAGFQVFVLNSNYLQRREEDAILTALGHFPEALILAGIEQTAHARRALRHAGIPIVQTTELAERPIDINIGLSHLDAARAATLRLFELGHRNVGHLAAPLDSRSRQRMAGYIQAVEQFNGRPTIASTDDASSVACGGALLIELMAKAPATTAVSCGNDTLALGALFECQRRGICVPGEFSIIGFHDLEFSASAHPTLSTVATPRYEMARRAAEIVIEIVRGSGRRPKERRIDLGFRVIDRESTAALVPH